MENSLSSIVVVSSDDAGCNWTDAEQAEFARHVEAELESVYGVDVECTVETAPSSVRVYGDRHLEAVTVPDGEEALVRSIKALVQDVWDRGEFWANEIGQQSLDDVDEPPLDAGDALEESE